MKFNGKWIMFLFITWIYDISIKKVNITYFVSMLFINIIIIMKWYITFSSLEFENKKHDRKMKIFSRMNSYFITFCRCNDDKIEQKTFRKQSANKTYIMYESLRTTYLFFNLFCFFPILENIFRYFILLSHRDYYYYSSKLRHTACRFTLNADNANTKKRISMW